MKTAAIALMIVLGSVAGVATGAEQRVPATPDQDVCLRRDITPEEYNQRCVIQNGPPHRPIHRRQGIQAKAGTR